MLFLIAAWGLLAVIVGVAVWPSARHVSETVPAKSEPTVSASGGAMPALVRWVPSRYRPTALALILALVSLPLVALTLAPTSAADYMFDQPIPATALG